MGASGEPQWSAEQFEVRVGRAGGRPGRLPLPVVTSGR
jgi:hypothetical protein